MDAENVELANHLIERNEITSINNELYVINKKLNKNKKECKNKYDEIIQLKESLILHEPIHKFCTILNKSLHKSYYSKLEKYANEHFDEYVNSLLKFCDINDDEVKKIIINNLKSVPYIYRKEYFMDETYDLEEITTIKYKWNDDLIKFDLINVFDNENDIIEKKYNEKDVSVFINIDKKISCLSKYDEIAKNYNL